MYSIHTFLYLPPIDEIYRVAQWYTYKEDSRRSYGKHFQKQTFLNGVLSPLALSKSPLSWRLN